MAKRVTIKQVGYNYYEVRVGGVPKYTANGRIVAERQANLLRKKQGKRVR